MQRVRSDALDGGASGRGFSDHHPVRVRRDCPNRDIAKCSMLAQACFQWPRVRWLHDNVYDDPEMGTCFGLFGILAFFAFSGTKNGPHQRVAERRCLCRRH
jgi:hypothetical protein